MNVAVIGASNKPQRISYQVIKKLLANGYQPFPVHPKIKEIDGLKVYSSPTEITEPIDTISLYVNAERSSKMQQEILNLNPRRIIFSPGAENDELRDAAIIRGIETPYVCTLILLDTGQF